jgi:hypothetical protein
VLVRPKGAHSPAKPRRARGKGSQQSRSGADERPRRVPNFVIEATGLDTKKKIVAKYGEGVRFEAGKPPPKPKQKAA